MREIKLRVWDGSKGEYVYQTLRELLDGIGDDCADSSAQRFRHLVLHDDVEPEEFTGLLDKNGVEIYEGDILGAGEWGNFWIFWNKFYLDWSTDSSRGTASLSEWNGRNPEQNMKHKIVGNVHEDKGLMI